MLVVVGQPAAVLAQCVGRRYKLKLCEQHFGRAHVRTCAQGFREASVSPVSEAVGVSDFRVVRVAPRHHLDHWPFRLRYGNRQTAATRQLVPII